MRRGATFAPLALPLSLYFLYQRSCLSFFALTLSLLLFNYSTWAIYRVLFFLVFKGGSKVLFVILCPLAIGAIIYLSPSGCLSGLVVFTTVLCSDALSVFTKAGGVLSPRPLACFRLGRSLVFRGYLHIRPRHIKPLYSYFGRLTLLF